MSQSRGPRPWLLVLVPALAAGVAAAGCDRIASLHVNMEQLRKDVLQADPAFAQALATHDELANRISVLERELSLKRTQTERQVTQLRAELQAATAQVKQSTATIKALLNPTVERVELAISMASEELKTKRRQRAGLGRQVSQLRKSLKQPNGPWTDAERLRMDRDLSELLVETQRIDEEAAALQQHLRLLKNKRLLLRL